MDRRTFLAGAATGTVALAGCSGTSGNASEGDTETSSDGGSDGGQTLDSHPAGRALNEQPLLGDISTGTVIVAFEDPSCPTCRRFETTTVPEIRSKLVETGKAAFAYRGIPIIYEWGDPATHVLEAAYDASSNAFWALKNHYYAEQSAFSTDNVYDRSRTFLADQTDVDADAVVAAAQDGAYDAAVKTDLDASKDLGVRGTPTCFLFRDGAFQTEVRGAQGYSVFKTGLGY